AQALDERRSWLSWLSARCRWAAARDTLPGRNRRRRWVKWTRRAWGRDDRRRLGWSCCIVVALVSQRRWRSLAPSRRCTGSEHLIHHAIMLVEQEPVASLEPRIRLAQFQEALLQRLCLPACGPATPGAG